MDLKKIEYFVGLDVAKDTIAVYFSNTEKYIEIPNETKAFDKAFKFINPENTLAVMETTGGYENKCLDWLMSYNIPIFKVDNKKFRDYKKSHNVAKTDKIDATMLAKYGKSCQFEKSIRLFKPKQADFESLKQYSSYLSELKTIRAAEKKKLQSPGFEFLKEAVKETISALDQRIKIIEGKVKELVNQCARMKEKIKLLSEYRGIGEDAALSLLLNIPELGTIGKNAIASLGGLAPQNNDSGKQNGYRRTGISGRPIIGKILYMCAMVNVRKTTSDNPIKDMYNKLRSKGKRRMVSLVACMRKMLVQLNAIARDGEIKCEKMKKPSSQIKKTA